jgi:hypothetical protein
MVKMGPARNRSTPTNATEIAIIVPVVSQRSETGPSRDAATSTKIPPRIISARDVIKIELIFFMVEDSLVSVIFSPSGANISAQPIITKYFSCS